MVGPVVVMVDSPFGDYVADLTPVEYQVDYRGFVLSSGEVGWKTCGVGQGEFFSGRPSHDCLGKSMVFEDVSVFNCLGSIPPFVVVVEVTGYIDVGSQGDGW